MMFGHNNNPRNTLNPYSIALGTSQDDITRLRKEIINLEKTIERIKEDRKVLSTIAMDIVGKHPELQRGCGEYFHRYANQRELPYTRDIIISLLNISSTDLE